jgi:hypothetical protein
MAVRKAGMGGSLAYGRIQNGEGGFGDTAPLSDSREQRIESFTKTNGVVEGGTSPPGRAICEPLQGLRFSGAQHICLFRPLQQISIAMESFLPLLAGAIVHGVGKVQAEIPSAELKRQL